MSSSAFATRKQFLAVFVGFAILAAGTGSAFAAIATSTSSVQRFDIGGNTNVDSLGNQWLADTGQCDGTRSTSTAPIDDTTRDLMYQSRRSGITACRFAVASGTYLVRLHFSDPDFSTSGRRVFDVVVEGNTAFENLDVAAKAHGGNRPYSAAVTRNVSDGLLTIIFRSKISLTTLSGVEITRTSTGPVTSTTLTTLPPPTTTPATTRPPVVPPTTPPLTTPPVTTPPVTNPPVTTPPANPGPGDAIPRTANTVEVSNSAQLNDALLHASGNTTVLLANGNYNQSAAFVIRNVAATPSAPLVIKSKTAGGAIITGTAFFQVKTSSNIVIADLRFENSANSSVAIYSSNNVRLTNNMFDQKENGTENKWIYIDGENSNHNRIDHNTFDNKSDLGNYITVYGGETQISQYDRIDHNTFRNVGPKVENGKEAVRIGWSGMSMSNGYTVIENNLFQDCNGEVEAVSIKASNITIRYNTFIRVQGTLSLRHGNDSSVYGNRFLGEGTSGTGGIRIYGQRQKVWNNYFTGLTGVGSYSPILVGGADVDTSGELNLHWRVYNAFIVNNTLVDNAAGITIAYDYPLTPVDSTIANNIVTGSIGKLINEVRPPVRMRYAGNILFAKGSATTGVTTGTLVVNPQLVQVAGIWRPATGSPAVNASVGSNSFVTLDIDGQPRTGRTDIGAHELQ